MIHKAAQRLRTTLVATCIGSIASRSLNENKGPIGTVTNTFPNSFYARMLNDELTFVTNRSLKSPITINIDSQVNFQQLVQPQEQITIDGTEVVVGESASINLAGAVDYATHPVSSVGRVDLAKIREALNMTAMILRILDTKGSVLDESGLTYIATVEFLQNGIVPLRLSDVEQLKQAAETLVGLGSGFTPSGDDLLGGFLAAYNSLAEGIGRQRILLDLDMLKSKTSWISAKLLDYMQRLILDEQMQQIIASGVSGNGDELISALESLVARGHTSGIDIAVGAVLALSAARDIVLSVKETEILARNLGLMP